MKTVYVVFGVLVLVLISCTTTNVFDESIPLDGSTTLNMKNGLTVAAYNGMEVTLEKPARYYSGSGSIEFIIPAGYTELLLYLSITENMGYANISYRAVDIPLSYDFKPGHTYDILFSYINDEGKVPGFTLGAKRALIIDDKDDDITWRTPLHFVELNFKF